MFLVAAFQDFSTLVPVNIMITNKVFNSYVALFIPVNTMISGNCLIVLMHCYSCADLLVL